ncbi:MAG: hypothetical protein Q8K92_26520 [Leadbetterella sp.]|nr:hypothetical protein [Leadbetterella sp.]
MKNKIIGISIIGVVTSIASATLIKFLVQKYNDYNIYLLGQHVNTSQYRENSVWATSNIWTADGKPFYHAEYEKIFNLYDADAIYIVTIFLGIVVTIHLIQDKLSLPKVFRNMLYTLFVAIGVGIFLGFLFATGLKYDNYDYRSKAIMWYFNFDLSGFKNCIYIGLGIAALIFGLDLVNKKSAT